MLYQDRQKCFNQPILASIAVVILCLILLVLSRNNKIRQSPLSWQPSTQVVSNELLQTALQQNISVSSDKTAIDEKKVLILPIPSSGKGKLYIFDFNTAKLCGSGGCLYAVYTQSGKSVLSLLLDSRLPKGVSLFELDEGTRNGFNCLVVAQSNNEGVLRNRYCYEGRGFAKVNSWITKN